MYVKLLYIYTKWKRLWPMWTDFFSDQSYF